METLNQIGINIVSCAAHHPGLIVVVLVLIAVYVAIDLIRSEIKSRELQKRIKEHYDQVARDMDAQQRGWR